MATVNHSGGLRAVSGPLAAGPGVTEQVCGGLGARAQQEGCLGCGLWGGRFVFGKWHTQAEDSSPGRGDRTGGRGQVTQA